jgi:predicted deacylase
LKLIIDGQEIRPGEHKIIRSNIARLPSGTDIDLPSHIYRSKNDGPVVLLSAGLHGDEINGIEIIRRMIRRGVFKNLLKGSVVAVPVMNIFGFLNFSREVPDGKDINRSFPGTASGSLASRVANYLTKNILTNIDFGVDFHTGGASRFNHSQIRFAKGNEFAKELAGHFRAPVTLQSGLIAKSLRKQAHSMGKTILVFEGGESMRIDEDVIEQGIAGTRRMLSALGMIGPIQDKKGDSLFCYDSKWIRAKRSGIYRGMVSSGTRVAKGDVLGEVSDPFNAFNIKIKAPEDGFVLGHNNMPVVNQGDALIHLGLLGNSSNQKS